MCAPTSHGESASHQELVLTNAKACHAGEMYAAIDAQLLSNKDLYSWIVVQTSLMHGRNDRSHYILPVCSILHQ